MGSREASTAEKPPSAEKDDDSLEPLDPSGRESAWVVGNESIVPSGGGSVERFRGGAVSTMSDYLRFCEMLLRGGIAPDGQRVLSEAAVQLVSTDMLSIATEGRCQEMPEKKMRK